MCNQTASYYQIKVNPYSDPSKYQKLVGKLNYFTITRPDISHVSVVNQFMQSLDIDHWNVMLQILRYIKNALGQWLLHGDKGNNYCDVDWVGLPIDRRSTLGYYVFVGSNLVFWRSMMQNVVAWSSALILSLSQENQAYKNWLSLHLKKRFFQRKWNQYLVC